MSSKRVTAWEYLNTVADLGVLTGRFERSTQTCPVCDGHEVIRHLPTRSLPLVSESVSVCGACFGEGRVTLHSREEVLMPELYEYEMREAEQEFALDNMDLFH